MNWTDWLGLWAALQVIGVIIGAVVGLVRRDRSVLGRGSSSPSLPRGPRRARRVHDGAPVQPATGAEVEKRTPRRCPSVPAAG